jgi:hypothetical protein
MMIESYEWYKAHREEVLGSGKRSPHRSAMKQGMLALLEHVI